jgi:hypothetical protein
VNGRDKETNKKVEKIYKDRNKNRKMEKER